MNSHAGVRDFTAAQPGTQSSPSRRAGSSFPAAAATVSPSTNRPGTHLHAHGDRRYRPRYRRAALQSRDVVRNGRIGSTNSSPAGGILERTAEAAAGEEGVAVQSSFFDGVAFYQITDKGLMG